MTRSADCEHLLKLSNCSSDCECKVVSSGSCMGDGILSLVRGQLSLGSASSPILSKNEIHQSVVDESEADSRLRQSELRPAQDMCGTSIAVRGSGGPTSA